MLDQFFPYKMFELHRKLMELTYHEMSSLVVPR